jgi:AcrR family transcriptional regulator
VYRYFASKDELLVALSAHEKARFEAELAEALHGTKGEERIDRALRFIVAFQHEYAMRGLVAVEPGFMLEQLEVALTTMAVAMVPLFTGRKRTGITPADQADLVVRIALSHFLIRGNDAQLLRELRHVAGIRR